MDNIFFYPLPKKINNKNITAYYVRKKCIIFIFQIV